MIEIKRGLPEHVEGISRVCTEGCLDTYKGIRSQENIERNNEIFYNHNRILSGLDEKDGCDEARSFSKDSEKLAYSNSPDEDYISLRYVRKVKNKRSH